MGLREVKVGLGWVGNGVLKEARKDLRSRVLRLGILLVGRMLGVGFLRRLFVKVGGKGSVCI